MTERVGRDDLPDAVGVEPGPGLGGLDQQHHEFVPAVARDDVDAAGVLQQDLGDVAQDLVARRVPQAVVDVLEAVQVEQHDRDRVVEPAVAADLLFEPDREEAAIVEPGHVVLERELLQAGVGGLQLLVGGVEPAGERVDFLGLALDRAEHAREALHEGADLVGAVAQRARRPGLLDDLRGAGHGGRHVPDHVGAGGHEQSREQQEHLEAQHDEPMGLAGQQREDVGVEDIGEDQERDEGREDERDEDLLLDPLPCERDLSVRRRHANHYFCWPRSLSMREIARRRGRLLSSPGARPGRGQRVAGEPGPGSDRNRSARRLRRREPGGLRSTPGGAEPDQGRRRAPPRARAAPWDWAIRSGTERGRDPGAPVVRQARRRRRGAPCFVRLT